MVLQGKSVKVHEVSNNYFVAFSNKSYIQKNNNLTYDGKFNVWDTSDKNDLMARWNDADRIPEKIYTGDCAIVQG